MFGYIYVNEQELKIREYTAYRSFYCGLCRNLHLRYGRLAQMMLNYDLTFLAILLNGLYEPDTRQLCERCIPHPMGKHPMVDSEAVSYAADMSVLLSYQKLSDDWEDERKKISRAMMPFLKKAYAGLVLRYPRQAKAVEENIRLLRKAEQEGIREIDYVAGLTGHFLGEIFVWKEDVWQDDLRRMGFFLGKFIYLMDALEDREKDLKHGSYNLFSDDPNIWSQEKEGQIWSILTDMMAEVSKAFERLPIVENVEIMRNILYSGVWCKYAAMRKRETDKEEKESGKL